MFFKYSVLILLVPKCYLSQKAFDPRDIQLPVPGDPNYKTYVHNSRRYGQAIPIEKFPKFSDTPRNVDSNYAYPGQNFDPVFNPNYNPALNPNYNPGSGSYYDPLNQFNLPDRSIPPGLPGSTLPLPGVLGGWRTDLQGKLRPDSFNLNTNKDLFVKTSYGPIQGFKVNLYDNPHPEYSVRPEFNPVERVQGTVSAFLGIPYALPPVDEGRFRPPRPHKGWQNLQAVDFGPACPQPLEYVGPNKGVRDMHEDCLYLNIYSPMTGAGVPRPYPVMVYIHGGDFSHGSSNLFPGHMMAGFYEVIVVTINYRLGALGFLSTGDQNSPGNYGILDQAMALQWVHGNIEYFNGDKDSITLFGPGAGAASAGLLMVNPRTWNMVTRVIAQSGSGTADWALIQDKWRVQNTSRLFAQHLGCSSESSWKIVDCLKRGRSSIELGNANFKPQVGMFAWGPVLDINFTVPADHWYDGWYQKDWYFTNHTTEQYIKEGRFSKKLSYMTGVTTQEAAYIVANNASLKPYYIIDNVAFDQKLKELVLQYNYTLNSIGAYQAIKYIYTYWPDPNNVTHIRDQYINMLSDFLYRAPVDNIVKLLVEKEVPVYMYVMNTTVEALRYPEWCKYRHDIEHYFLVGAPFMDIEFLPAEDRLKRNMWTDNDRNMSHFFMKAYTNFAKYGDPTFTQILGLHFEKAVAGTLKYLNLNTTYNSSIQMNYRQTESAFWTWYLPLVVGVVTPTYPPFTEYWWEPRTPIQVAFWSVSTLCMVLLAAVVIFCILWKTAKRNVDHYYSGDIFVRDDTELTLATANGVGGGIDNRDQRSVSNIYEYRDTPPIGPITQKKPPPASDRSDSKAKMSASNPSLRTGSGSASSLKDNHSVSSNPIGSLSRSPGGLKKGRSRSNTLDTDSVPQAEV
uniref:Neuroligin-2 n=1 Tax=Cacopsylla melanoneura TaxID=428564 RepID=A0A8D8YR27_9HEMI